MRTCLEEVDPICRACGQPACQHPDPVFAGIIPDRRDGFARDSKADGFGRVVERFLVHGSASA